MLRESHWYFITIETDSGTVSFWNSLEDETYEREERGIIKS